MIELRISESVVPRYDWKALQVKDVPMEEAQKWFDVLPIHKQIATLSPEYAFIDSLRDPTLKPWYLLMNDPSNGDFWLHSIHMGQVPDSHYYDIQSPYGYGGPVAHTIEDLECGDSFGSIAYMKYRQWCWRNHILAEFMRFHPLLDQTYGGDKVPNRQTVVVPAGSLYSASCRHKIRQAKRAGVVVEQLPREVIFSRFMDFYREGLERLSADKFYYFNEDYFDLLAKWPKAHLFVATIDGDWVSAGIFLESGETLEYHLSSTNQYGRETAATNALIDFAMQYVKGRELRKLFLGGGKTADPGDPLLEFKKSFGGKLKTFHIGTAIHRGDAYYAMQEKAFDVPPVNPKVLWWR